LLTQNGEDLPQNPDNYGPQVVADYITDYIDRKAGSPFFIAYRNSDKKRTENKSKIQQHTYRKRERIPV
jgi:hypothetical protein